MSVARGIGFDIQFDVEGMIEDFKKLAASADETIDAGLSEYGMLSEEAGKALAPYDSGDLVTSIQFQGLKTANGERQGSVGSDLEYALRRHEEPYRMGTHDKYDNGVKFEKYYVNGRGRRTHRRPGFRGQKAGRKYLERSQALLEPDHLDIMQQTLEAILRGRSY